MNIGNSRFTCRHRSMLLIYLIATVANLSFAYASKCATAPDNSNASLIYKWVPLHWQGKNLYAVGDRKLIAPLVLPGWLRPLGNKALIADLPMRPKSLFQHEYQILSTDDLRRYEVNIFLDPRQTTRVQEWLNDFPNAFLLPPGSYSIKSAITASNTIVNGGWGGVFRAKDFVDGSQFWSYNVVLHIPAKGPHYIFTLGANPLRMPSHSRPGFLEASAPGLPEVLTSSVSPIKNLQKAIWLHLIYDIKK